MTERSARRAATATPTRKRRTRGEGSIYRTAQGWRAALLVDDPATGQQRRRYLSGATADEVRRKLSSLRAATERGATTAGPRLTTGAYLEAWTRTIAPTIRPSTLRGYAGHVNTYWRPLLGATSLAQLSPGDVERAMAQLLERGLSAQTVRGARSTLRRALGQAARDGFVTRNAASLARPPRLPSREIDYLEPADVRALVAGTAGDRLAPLWVLGATTGLRLGELLGLAWPDVNTAARTLSVRRSLARAAGGGWALAEPKTHRSRRTIPLPAMALAALEERRAAQEAEHSSLGSAWQDRDQLVFTDPIGRPLDPMAASHAWRAAARPLGITLPFRALRHTAATTWLRNGVPLIVVAEALGHTGVSITQAHYAAVAPELRSATAEAMDRALG